MRRSLPLAIALFAVGPAGQAEAQVCHGTPPFGPDRHVNINLEATDLNGPTLNSGRSRSVNVDFGVHEYFARATVGRNTYSDYGYTSTEVDAAFGQIFDVWSHSTLVLCPETELSYEHTGDISQGQHLASSTRAAVLSLRVGSLHRIGQLPVSGFVAVGLDRSSTKVAFTDPRFGVGSDVSNGFGGFAEIGAGLAVFRVVNVIVTYRMPLGLEFGLRSTSLQVGIAF